MNVMYGCPQSLTALFGFASDVSALIMHYFLVSGDWREASPDMISFTNESRIHKTQL